MTANLGVEKIIRNIISNPNIRYLLLCGAESPVFHPGQTLQSLFEKGIDSNNRIIGAQGHYPVLANIGRKHIEHFRNHIALIDCTGEVSLDALQQTIRRLASRPAPKTTRKYISEDTLPENKDINFTPLHPDELLSQLSHAGYLGVELGKAETALRLGVDYEQDHPVQP